MNINYVPFISVNKNNRVYTLLLPVDAPYKECNEVLLDMAQGILVIQKKAQEEADKLKLEQEIADAKAEAAAD